MAAQFMSLLFRSLIFLVNNYLLIFIFSKTHAVRIAVNTQRMDSAVSSDNLIFKMAEFSINVFKSSIDSIAQEDLQTINKTVEEAKNVSQFGVSLESQKVGNTDNVEISMVLESLRRIAEYSGDIAEASINMNVKI